MESVERFLAGDGRDSLVGPFEEDTPAGVFVYESLGAPVPYGLCRNRWRELFSVLEGDDIFQQDLGVSFVLGHVAFLGVPVVLPDMISGKIAAVKSDIQPQVLINGGSSVDILVAWARVER